MTAVSADLARTWKHTFSIATLFWGACLVLVAIEATLGSNFIVATLFFLSIPMLVACLTWANLAILFGRPRSLVAVCVLGLSVLCSSTVIIFVGLVAAANLKQLIVGA